MTRWIKRLIDDVSHTCGIPAVVIMDGSKGYGVVARHLLCWALRETVPGDPSWRVLAKATGFDHTVLRYGWSRIRAELSERDAFTTALVAKFIDNALERSRRLNATRQKAAVPASWKWEDDPPIIPEGSGSGCT